MRVCVCEREREKKRGKKQIERESPEMRTEKDRKSVFVNEKPRLRLP